MELKDYENKIGHSIEKMSYEEMLEFLEINKDKSIKYNISYGDAYWLRRLYNENRITPKEYDVGVSVLREALSMSKYFNRIFIEAEDPTGKTKDHWEFYLSD